MAWPPVIPPATRANSTPQIDTHPADHNAISTALTDIRTWVDRTAWTALPFGAGWSNSAGQQIAQYRRNGDVVELRGCVGVDNAATHGLMGTLPAGFRPGAIHIFAIWSIGAAGGGGTCRVDVAADGQILLQGGLTGAIGYISISQIRFATT